MNRVQGALVVCCSLVLVASCERARRVYVPNVAALEARTIRVGTYASLTGPDAEVGRAEQRGLSLAVSTWNAANPVNFDLVTYDIQSRPAAAASALRRFASEQRIPLVAVGHEHERAEALAELVARTMSMSRVTVLVRDGVAADRAAADAFSASANARDIRTGEPRSFTPENIGEVLTALVADAPPAILVAMEGRAAALVGRALRRRSVPAALLFFGAPDVQALPAADRAAALDGALFPCAFDAESPPASAAGFVAAYRARFEDAATESAYLAFRGTGRALSALARASNPLDVDPKTAWIADAPDEALVIYRAERDRFVPLLPPKP